MRKAITVAVFVASTTLLTGPTANADPDGEAWAAIAYSTSTGDAKMISNGANELEAQDEAVAGCNSMARDNSCKVVISGNHCVSLATDPDPTSNEGFAGGRGMTQAEADTDAMRGADSEWSIDVHGCTRS